MAIDGQIGVRNNNFWNGMVNQNIGERDRQMFRILGVVLLTLAFYEHKMNAPAFLSVPTYFLGSYYIIAGYTGKPIYVFAGVVSAVALPFLIGLVAKL